MMLGQVALQKKIWFLLLVCYSIALHFVYSRYWKGTKLEAVEMLFGENSRASMRFLMMLPVDVKSSSSNATNVAGLTATTTPVHGHSHVDVHVEDPVLGHAGEVVPADHNDSVTTPSAPSGRRQPRATIAVGGGITSGGLRNIKESTVASQLLFFGVFLPTFCSTASRDFAYRIYLAYDHSDPVFRDGHLQAAFRRSFVSETRRLCTDVDVSLHLVECSHAGKPTWAQNDAMLEAYVDHVDYFYRVNDDTRMLTGGWTEKFISTLEGYDPPRVGVVGPNHSGGNVAILTYDFVHRTHVDIFGFYYPRVFTSWWADDWITRVYSPQRSRKHSEVRLSHTMALGKRYITQWAAYPRLLEQIALHKQTVNRYVLAINRNKASGVKPDGRKVISMSLYGKDPRYTWGALRNAQLVPVYLPDWTLRVYVAAHPAPSELAVPPRILDKLRHLGAEIAEVLTGNSMAPRNWRLLVANDRHVDYFLVRDADTRLSEREAVAVRDWISTTEKNASRSVIHCIRDHPKHIDLAIVDGLWGGRPRELSRLLRQNVTEMMNSAASNVSSSSVRHTSDAVSLLNQVLWPAVSNWSYCHDSVSPCDRWTPLTSRRPFPLPRQGREYVGQKFDAHQELLSEDGHQLKADVVCYYANNNTQNTSTSSIIPQSTSVVYRETPRLLLEHLTSISGLSIRDPANI